MLLVSREAGRHQGRDAVTELYKAQGNDPFWHGVFGGLYLPHLREAAYYHLLESEKSLALAEGWEVRDYDADGRDELIYRSGPYNLLIKPSFGGALVELDDRRLSRNLTDVLSRREESYHRQKPNQEGEGKSIHELDRKLPADAASLMRYDWHPRYSLLDHFLAAETTPESFQNIDYREQGDFVNQEYRFELAGGEARLARTGHIWSEGGPKTLRVSKAVLPQSDDIRFLYTLENAGPDGLTLLFGIEWNFYLLPHEWQLEDRTLTFLGGRWRMEFSETPAIWTFPLLTVSQSEEDYDIIHQGMCFLPNWKIRLPPGQKQDLFVTMRVVDGE
jgi:hypothetical protein